MLANPLHLASYFLWIFQSQACSLELKPDGLFNEGELYCYGFENFSNMGLDQLRLDEENSHFFYTSIKLTPLQALIIDTSFSVSVMNATISNLSMQSNLSAYFYPIHLTLGNLKGIDLNFTYLASFRQNGIMLNLMILFSRLDLYVNAVSIGSDCTRDNLDRLILNTEHLKPLDLASLTLRETVKFSDRTCSAMFLNARVEFLVIYGISTTLTVRNRLAFQPLIFNNLSVELNSSVGRLEISIWLDHLSSDLLHPQIFINTQELIIYGNFDSMEPCALFPFRKTHLSLKKAENYLRNKLGWCPHYHNSTQDKIIIFKQYNEFKNENLMDYKFADEDFCSFARMPVNNRTFFVLPAWVNCSCAAIWIMRNYQSENPLLYSNEWFALNGVEFYNKCLNQTQASSSNYSACDFDTRLGLCNLESMQPAVRSLSIEHYLGLVRSLLILFSSPLICFVGAVLNAFTSQILNAVNNELSKKPFDETNRRAILMYTYLRHHSIAASLLCLLFMFKPLIECVGFTDLYCSPLYLRVDLRLTEAILFNMLGSALKLYCTLAMMLFSLVRLVINFSGPSKPIKASFFASRLNTISFVCLFTSCLFASIKLFATSDQSVLALNKKDILWPLKRLSFSSFVIVHENEQVFPVIAFNLGFEAFTDCFLPALILFVDFYLFIILRQFNRQRSETLGLRADISLNNEKNMMKMLFLNAVFSATLKTPQLVYNLNLITTRIGFASSIVLKGCQDSDDPLDSLCPLLNDIAHSAYFLSFSLNFFLLLKYNKMFAVVAKAKLTK
nr:G protein-coupled receptor [Proales similis]